MSDLKSKIEEQIKSNKIVIYMKGTTDFPQCGFSAQAVSVLRTLNEPIFSVDVLSDDPLWTALEEFTQWPTVPQIFINGEFVGGCDIITEMYERGNSQGPLLKSTRFQSILFAIGPLAYLKKQPDNRFRFNI